ncbi:hypothetical protein F5Y04DRAFT_18353 [Hypomontagnella monticulosa]|nr:hypothetical protein F5Y04DRAFT_18353 [Hypomontagnella monticulosa]
MRGKLLLSTIIVSFRLSSGDHYILFSTTTMDVLPQVLLKYHHYHSDDTGETIHVTILVLLFSLIIGLRSLDSNKRKKKEATNDYIR